MALKLNPRRELEREVKEVLDTHPALKADQAFVVWFLKAYATSPENEGACVSALTGPSRDKNIDAIFMADDPGIVFLIQGKYRGVDAGAESRSEIMTFAQAAPFFLGAQSQFNELTRRADPAQQSLMQRAYRRIQKGYQLQLYFVTTGTVSKNHRQEAELVANRRQASIQFFDRPSVYNLVNDYIQGAAPPIPALDLAVEGQQLFDRYDPVTKISSWVFPIHAKELNKLYARFGVRIFARNVRGFLGDDTPVNESMQRTLKRNPDRFWYFNNGVTMVCDDAEAKAERDKTFIRARNVQIINGQQTTRVLASLKNAPNSSVLVKVLAIPREHRFESFIGEIVKATNFQNAISQADLRSNDETQVRLERELRLLGYIYMRKRQSRREARMLAGGRGKHFFLTKEVLAKAVGSSLLAPDFWRQSQQRLFDDQYYPVVFDRDRPAREYLLFFWLHKLIRRCSRDDPRRGYATYLILDFLWKQIGEQLSSHAARDSFIRAAERDGKHPEVIRDLTAIGNLLLDAAMGFMRLSSKGSSARDISGFFRSGGVDDDFAKYWRSDRNSRRPRLRQFVERLFADLSAVSN